MVSLLGIDDLVKKVNVLKAGSVSGQISKRMSDFKGLHDKGNEEWFSELCFCILTAYSMLSLV